MDNNKIKNYYAHDYFKAINTDDCIFPITEKYYEPKKRVLSLSDIELVFNGYELNTSQEMDTIKALLIILVLLFLNGLKFLNM